jgi:CRP-like cAMP-binding protein
MFEFDFGSQFLDRANMAIYDIENILNYFRNDQVAERTLAAEEVLFRQGSPTQSVYFVVEGEVRVESYLEDGRSVVFYRVHSGGALSEENLYFPAHLYTGVATVETVVRSIAKVDFLERMKTDAKLSPALTSCLAERYAHALMLRELMGIKAAEDRLLTWLHWQCPAGEKWLQFKGHTGDLAPELGLSKESVYRAFARLKESGKIRMEDGRIEIINGVAER